MSVEITKSQPTKSSAKIYIKFPETCQTIILYMEANMTNTKWCELSAWPGTGPVWDRVKFTEFIVSMREERAMKQHFNNWESYFEIKQTGALYVHISDLDGQYGCNFKLHDHASALVNSFSQIRDFISKTAEVLLENKVESDTVDEDEFFSELQQRVNDIPRLPPSPLKA